MLEVLLIQKTMANRYSHSASNQSEHDCKNRSPIKAWLARLATQRQRARTSKDAGGLRRDGTQRLLHTHPRPPPNTHTHTHTLVCRPWCRLAYTSTTRLGVCPARFRAVEHMLTRLCTTHELGSGVGKRSGRVDEQRTATRTKSLSSQLHGW